MIGTSLIDEVDPEEAARLARLGITSTVCRRDGGITYEVLVGERDDGARRIWSHRVLFGSDARHRAGGAAFVEAVREQERQVRAMVAMVDEGAGR